MSVERGLHQDGVPEQLAAIAELGGRSIVFSSTTAMVSEKSNNRGATSSVLTDMDQEAFADAAAGAPSIKILRRSH